MVHPDNDPILPSTSHQTQGLTLIGTLPVGDEFFQPFLMLVLQVVKVKG